jgi:hypothetical protein
VRDETIVKITAIVALVILEVVNLFTMKVDGSVLLTIGSIIGGLAGYEIGKSKSVKNERANRAT